MDDIENIRYIVENLILILEENLKEIKTINYKEKQENNDFSVEILVKYLFEYVELYANKLGIKATKELFKNNYLIKYNGIGYEIGVINDLNKTYYYKMIPLENDQKFIDLDSLDYENLNKENKRTLNLN